MSKLIRIIRNIIHDLIMVLVPRFMRKGLMSCKEVAEILSGNTDLSKQYRFKLKMHLMICQCCTDYSEQLNIISTKSKKLKSLELTQEQKKQVVVILVEET